MDIEPKIAGKSGFGVICLITGAIILLPAVAAAQPVAGSPPPSQDFLETVSRWFDQQAEKLHLGVSRVRRQVEKFGHEAGVAARATVGGAQDAAGAVARIPQARVVSGYERCRTASNGAPDCVTAADAVCKAQGYRSGKSIDMTTAEICPPRVWMAGKTTGPACHTETFVSSAICQ